VALSPDMGERHLETIYRSNWGADLYGDDVLTPIEPATDQLATTSQAA
jgi:hypothetical protein